jgi:acetyltransferase EpsM
MEKILLIGAGAGARDMIDFFGADRFVAAYVDPQFAQAGNVDGVPIVIDWTQAIRMATHYMLAVSAIDHRERAVALAAAAGLIPASPLVSAMARVAATATLAPGCMVGHFSAVGSAARIDENCLIMHGVVVGHNSIIEPNVIVCAGVSIGGYVTLGARTFVGTNAVVAPSVSIGRDSFVAAGAACLRDAPANSSLIGNPAKRSQHG